MRNQKESFGFSLCRAVQPSWGRTVVWGLALTPLLLGPVFACRDRPVVDMSQVTAEDGNGIPSDPRPALRIAVAARISPETTQVLYDALLDKVADRVGRRAVFSQRRTYAEVNAMLEGKEIELAFVCAGPYTKGYEDFGMELLVVPLVRGKAVYHSYLLAGRDSPVQTFDDLRGRRFVFTDPDSNTGCLVPTFMLAERGETPGAFFSETFFTYSHDASIRAVADGHAAGAAGDSLVWDYCNARDPVGTSRTRIIERSPPFGIPPVVVHPDLEPELKEALREVFLGLHEDPVAAGLMRQLRIDRFTEGEDAAYDSVREMRRWIEESTGGLP
ncbi:MAG: PhnD/SsuA/transferrin family substrate-binding protein [Thermoanaerobaculales bacterium]|nr:PhnD/SsuA/transferrin family substrate-binding protein [Thermoanaerobaculales bacterium]